jgi:hypothetical protein
VPTDQDFGVVAGPPRPAFEPRDDSFWVQNLSVGVEFHY